MLIATAGFATAGGPYGVPVGTLGIFTKEAPLLQTRTGYPYTVSSDASMQNGDKKDPHGNLGVTRSYQNRLSGNVYSPATPIPIPINSKDWPSNSGLVQTRSYGPYTPGDYPSVPESYGRETITLVWVDGNAKTWVLDTKQILVYPAIANAQIYNALAPPLTALGTRFTGDPPRAMVQMNKVYPGAQSWAVIYPGTFRGTGAPSSPKISSSLCTAPLGDVGTAQVYVELGTLAATSNQTYTVQAFQQTAAYGVEPFFISAPTPANPQPGSFYATFSVDLHFNVNTEVGTSK